MRRFEVADRSMEPAFRAGDYLVAAGGRCLEPGDVVVFERPNGFHLLKRVAAVGGDTVRVAAGLLTTPHREPVEIPAQPDAEWTLQDGEVFVLSDAVMATRADSRTFGPVDASTCLKVVFRYWPVRRIRRFG